VVDADREASHVAPSWSTGSPVTGVFQTSSAGNAGHVVPGSTVPGPTAVGSTIRAAAPAGAGGTMTAAATTSAADSTAAIAPVLAP
jgi:hypothetical protein